VTLELAGVSLFVRTGAAAERALVRDLTLGVADAEVVTVMGPSGAGKSSLLAFACGALPGMSRHGGGLRGEGRVRVAGRDVTGLPSHRRRIGILFQDDLLFPHMSVGDNLAFGLDPAVRGRAARREAVARALEEAELPGMAARDPATLSGGQRARVALMRVLLSSPQALLLDEPFGRLDAALRGRFRDMVFAAAGARRLPVLLVTHEPADAAGRVVTLGGASGSERQ
jgi:putative thiamine transport system ATP-binding protein